MAQCIMKSYSLLLLLCFQRAGVSSGFSVAVQVRHCQSVQLKVSTSEPSTSTPTKDDDEDAKEFSDEKSDTKSFDMLEAKLEELRALNEVIEQKFSVEKEEMEKSSSKAWSVLEATEKGLGRLEAFDKGDWSDDFLYQTIGLADGGRTKNNPIAVAVDAKARGERLVSIIGEASKLRERQQERYEASTRALLGLSEAQNRLHAKYSDLQKYLVTDHYKSMAEVQASTSNESKDTKRGAKDRSRRRQKMMSSSANPDPKTTKTSKRHQEVDKNKKTVGRRAVANGQSEALLEENESHKIYSEQSPGNSTEGNKGTPGVHVLDIDSEHSPQRTDDVSEWTSGNNVIERDTDELVRDSVSDRVNRFLEELDDRPPVDEKTTGTSGSPSNKQDHEESVEKGNSIYGEVEPDQKRHEQERKKRSYRAVKKYDQNDMLSIELEEYDDDPIPTSSALTVVSEGEPQIIEENMNSESNHEETINPSHCQGNVGWMSFGSLSEEAGNHFML